MMKQGRARFLLQTMLEEAGCETMPHLGFSPVSYVVVIWVQRWETGDRRRFKARSGRNRPAPPFPIIDLCQLQGPSMMRLNKLHEMRRHLPPSICASAQAVGDFAAMRSF